MKLRSNVAIVAVMLRMMRRFTRAGRATSSPRAPNPRHPAQRDLCSGLLAIAAALVCCAGCSPPPPYVPVHGTVTYHGEPVEDVTVVFTGKGELGRAAADYTDSQGQFDLWTYVSPEVTADGAFPDDYDVYLSKRGPMELVVVQPGARKTRDIPQDGSVDPDEVFRLVMEGLVDPGPGPPMMRPGKSLIPVHYCVPNEPMFKVTVERGKPNEFNFVLEDEVPQDN